MKGDQGSKGSDTASLLLSAWGQVQEREPGHFKSGLAVFLALRLEESRIRNLLSLYFI